MVTYAIIPAMWEVEMARLWLEVSLGKKVNKTHLHKEARCGGTCYNPSSEGGRSMSILSMTNSGQKCKTLPEK
jgi:hypothetical protein